VITAYWKRKYGQVKCLSEEKKTRKGCSTNLTLDLNPSMTFDDG
jgi:hypothetical protein